MDQRLGVLGRLGQNITEARTRHLSCAPLGPGHRSRQPGYQSSTGQLALRGAQATGRGDPEVTV